MIIILVAIVLLIIQNTKPLSGKVTQKLSPLTGYATSANTTSNVTISKFLSITLCTNLSEGIEFGTVDTLPTTDQNGTHNYDGASSGTTYCVNVSGDGNTAVDICLGAMDNLTSAGADEIEISNESFAGNVTTTDSTTPGLANETSLTANSYQESSHNISNGSLAYYRFWLDIPAGTPSGTYENNLSFKGVETTLACGAFPT